MGSIIIDDVAILKCPICLDIFDRPKLLSCGHTLCATCVSGLCASSREQNIPFTCPECRRVVRIPRGQVEDLPPNYVIQRLLDDRGRLRTNLRADSWTQADSDVDGLTRVVFRLRQKQKSLAAAMRKVLDTMHNEADTVQKKGDYMKQHIDEEVTSLHGKIRDIGNDHVTRIRARLERIHMQLDSLTEFCICYGEMRRRNVTTGEFGHVRVIRDTVSRLHAVTEQVLRHELDYDDYVRPIHVPSFTFSPLSAAGLCHINLVGQLHQVDDRESTVETTISEGKAVWGMTIVDNKLYVLRDRLLTRSLIAVYDAETLTRMLNPRHFPRFRGATDITSSARHSCLYVGDEVDKCLFKIGLTRGCDRWSLGAHKPWCVSITSRDNVLVTLYDVNAIMEFRADGACVRRLSLEQVGIVRPQQTLQVPRGQLIVCHDTRRISFLNSDGSLIHTHGGVNSSFVGQPILGPCYLAADQNFIYVADVVHRRVAVYSSAMDLLREVVPAAQLRWWPLRLLVDGVRRRLYVADNDFDGQKYIAGRVVVFNLR